MTNATQERVRLVKVDNGRWLNRLLADVHTETALQPSAPVIERIRGRLLEEMRHPVRAAA